LPVFPFSAMRFLLGGYDSPSCQDGRDLHFQDRHKPTDVFPHVFQGSSFPFRPCWFFPSYLFAPPPSSSMEEGSPEAEKWFFLTSHNICGTMRGSPHLPRGSSFRLLQGRIIFSRGKRSHAKSYACATLQSPPLIEIFLRKW